MDGILEAEPKDISHEISKVEALELQNLRVKDPETLDRLLTVIPSLEKHLGIDLGDKFNKLSQLHDLNEVTRNNLTFLLTIPLNDQEEEHYVIKLGSEASFKDELKRLQFANEHFQTDPEASNIIFPKLVTYDEKARAIVTNYTPHSLKIEGSELYLSLFLDSLDTYNKIKPTQELIERFPPQVDTSKMNPKSYLKFAEERIQGFFEWLQKLENSFGDEESRKMGLHIKPQERAEYRELLKLIKSEGVIDKINERLESVRKLVEESNLPALSESDLKLCPTDLKTENTSFSQNKDGQPVLSNHDLESLRFGDMDLAVVKFTQFPTTLADFEHNPELLNTFLLNYAERQEYPQETLERLKVLMAVANIDLLGGVLRRFPTGPNNYRELYADRYPTVASALLNVNLPWLINYLNTPIPAINDDISQKRELSRDDQPEKNICPLTGKPPIDNWQEWIGELVDDADSWLENINGPLDKVNAAHPFSKEELLAKRSILFSKTLLVNNVGDGIYLVVNEFWPHDYKGESPLHFGYLTPDKERFQKKNGLLVAIGESNELEEATNTLFKNNTAIPFSIKPDLIEELLNKVQDPRRFRFFSERLKKLPQPSQNIPSIEIIDIGLDETLNDYFTVAIVKTSDGKIHTLKVNKVGREYSSALGYVIKDHEEITALLSNRPLTLSRDDGISPSPRREELEAIRAFGGKKYLLEAISRKTGLLPYSFDVQVSSVFRLKSDPDLEAVHTKFHTVQIITGSGKIWKDDAQIQRIDDEWRTYTLTQGDFFKTIAENKTRDPYTITAITMDMLNDGSLVLSKEAKDQSILLEKLFRVQGGNIKRYEIPRGNISLGIQSGEILPNSGSTRDKLFINNTNLEEFASALKDENREVVSVKLEDVIELIKKQQLDIITVSAIITLLVQKGLLLYKE